MTCSITKEANALRLHDPTHLLKSKDEGQLHYWGFQRDAGALVATPPDLSDTVHKVIAYFDKHHIALQLDADVQSLVAHRQSLRDRLTEALAAGNSIKSGEINDTEVKAFTAFAATGFGRTLKQHQLKAALHLLKVKNGANFSVPGSGKTTVGLSVFQWLRQQGEIDALFVVGPPSCFGPWRDEYRLVLGEVPRVEILAGGHIGERKNKYYVGKDQLCDLYLTSYQTLPNDVEDAIQLFNRPNIRIMLVVDEAHYIKQLDGIWADAVLRLAPYATVRYILTGTPFPRSYSDAFNLFDVLWPTCPPISPSHKARIDYYNRSQQIPAAADLLEQDIGPLFYRVRKSDLGLAEQIMHPPIMIEMHPQERAIYDAIVDRIQYLTKEDYLRDLDLILRLRRGRIIRLRQCLSYAGLLSSALYEAEDDVSDDKSIAAMIAQHGALELPAKLEVLLRMVAGFREKNEKVLIWSNFVGSLKLIANALRTAGHAIEMIYGETPTEKEELTPDVLTREHIVAEFCRSTGGVDVLVANPAACAESISLHKSCAHAIYYDMSYNCAQYLQSLDRIHRVGGSETKEAHYYFLQYEETIDRDILSNVLRKADRMRAIIDQDYPIYSLDMFEADDELEAYGQLFQ